MQKPWQNKKIEILFYFFYIGIKYICVVPKDIDKNHLNLEIV